MTMTGAQRHARWRDRQAGKRQIHAWLSPAAHAELVELAERLETTQTDVLERAIGELKRKCG